MVITMLPMMGLAADGTQITAQLRPDFTIIINDEVRTFTDANNTVVYPVLYNGTTYLPLRAVGNSLGMDVGWDGATQTVTLVSSDKKKSTSAAAFDSAISNTQITAQLRPDFTIIINGVIQEFSDVNGNVVYPVLYNGTTYLPLRAVGNSLGLHVDWDGATQTVVLSGEIPEFHTNIKTSAQTYTSRLYSASKKELIDTSELTMSYYCQKYDVKEGERLHVIGYQPSSSAYDLYTILDSNNNILVRGNYLPDWHEKEAYIIIPKDAAIMYVNGAVGYSASVIEYAAGSEITEIMPKAALSAKRIQDGIIVTDGDFTFTWRKWGYNNIMNFAGAAYKGNTLFSTMTDWIGPYDFSAENNADGDRLNPAKGVITSNTTGGNHNIYTDTPKNGTPTARTISWEVYADGIETNEIDIEGKVIEIRWVNRVQAGNTAKLDKNENGYGTGRECLEEHGFARFLGDGLIEVGVEFTPLEDIRMNWYSGLQFAGSSFAPDIYIPEYNKETMTTAEIDTYKNAAVVEYAVAKGREVCLEMYLDRNFGCGKNVVDYYYDGNGLKGYFVLFSRGNPSVDMIANEKYAWRGHYRFYLTE